MDDRQELKKKILDFFNQADNHKRLISTTEIHAMLNKGFYVIRSLLQELKAENKIEKRDIGIYTFWEIKK